MAVKHRSIKQLLTCLALGWSNVDMGKHFGCSHHTIEADLTTLYQRLGCNSKHNVLKRVEAVAIGFRRGIIE